jgi:hypothetical protein
LCELYLKIFGAYLTENIVSLMKINCLVLFGETVVFRESSTDHVNHVGKMQKFSMLNV